MLSLRIVGHSEYAEHGKDIICSAASILAYTLASIVESFDDDGAKPIIDLTSGDTTIACVCKDREVYVKVANAYHYTQIGYALLAQNYPQYVRLEALT